ncbi:hypothetical protein N7449_002460 [Penicillium cf. viridicatum]|uniref:Uncharacterized protein n=1 Tax=Penicillium cf. viridicatum TaxID=2972119 RepID=A0A9W9MV61_9EURO|nr:hypothetical protein N7449_002460 [Penicillium cf. viridicatum]
MSGLALSTRETVSEKSARGFIKAPIPSVFLGQDICHRISALFLKLSHEIIESESDATGGRGTRWTWSSCSVSVVALEWETISHRGYSVMATLENMHLDAAVIEMLPEEISPSWHQAVNET